MKFEDYKPEYQIKIDKIRHNLDLLNLELGTLDRCGPCPTDRAANLCKEIYFYRRELYFTLLKAEGITGEDNERNCPKNN